MKKKRPLYWVIVVLNAFYILNFFIGRSGLHITQDDPDSVILQQFQGLMIWLIFMNGVLYLIYRITGRKKGN
jgi:hypothetical protein